MSTTSIIEFHIRFENSQQNEIISPSIHFQLLPLNGILCRSKQEEEEEEKVAKSSQILFVNKTTELNSLSTAEIHSIDSEQRFVRQHFFSSLLLFLSSFLDNKTLPTSNHFQFNDNAFAFNDGTDER